MKAARTAALRLLNRRDYFAEELRTKLLAREFSAAEITDALASLTQDGLVNDRRVAESFVRVATELKGRGRYRIQRELEHRGAPRSVIQEVLSSLSVGDERASIRRFLDRKRLPIRLSPTEYRRVFSQLVRKGFSPELIVGALKSRGRDIEDEP